LKYWIGNFSRALQEQSDQEHKGKEYTQSKAFQDLRRTKELSLKLIWKMYKFKGDSSGIDKKKANILLCETKKEKKNCKQCLTLLSRVTQSDFSHSLGQRRVTSAVVWGDAE